MSEEETVTFNLELNVEPALNSMRQIEGLTFRTLGYMKRLGLPENVNQAIDTIQNVTMTLRLLHSAIIAIELASGPIGWWRAGLAIAGTGLALASTINEIDSTYDAQRGNS
jgi:hypothetical protein